MKIQHLRFFCAVVECRAVTAAAERLHVSQPAISAGLKALEQELGEPLFDRSGGKRRVIPTSRALRFYDDAKDILSRCDSARASFAAAPPPPALRVGVLRTLPCTAVAAVVAEAMGSSRPAWTVREGDAAEIARWLNQGRIDIAWTTVEHATATSEILWREPFAILVARQHRLALRPMPLTLADLSGEPFVLRTSCELRSGALQSSGLRFKVVARASRDDLALNLVAQGLGAIVAPRSFAGSDVVALVIDDLALARDIGLRWRSGLSETIIGAVRDMITLHGGPAL
ncbi:LysR family transcriptional regulator [Phreatobacter stygius]|uniref:LysR family transcriptional regulator n=1 Tax=Phreatobacter stygius TaxID=1940610 RepID=A0A4D7B4Z3_9HYPH|nr:LysR family transcriptional regulator [Phreatobacter stygius]QCI68031.1 LysR family transcriptional regulator [Phreatobacter stygius]